MISLKLCSWNSQIQGTLSRIVGELVSYCLISTEFQFGMMENSGDGEWWWLHHNVKVLKAILTDSRVKVKIFIMYLLYHNFKSTQKSYVNYAFPLVL
jgi:hypothetical protein